MKQTPGTPRKIFTILNVIAVIVGIVIGIGIFRLPPIVAQNASSGWEFILFWVAGGGLSILGALCYAELATSHPDAGGEYHFLKKAYGPALSFLFSWGRMTVIQTGSIALAGFILGDYASSFLELGPYSSSVYAAVAVVVLTALNIWGTRPSKRAQNAMAGVVVSMLLLLGLLGVTIGTPLPEASSGGTASGDGSAGLAMIFVLLTYGGWNEAAYLSGELRNVRRNMVKVLVTGILLITALYVLINLAYLQVLGLDGLRAADTVGIALADQVLGTGSGYFVGAIIILAALSTANATIITGARTNYALGRDFAPLGILGIWNRPTDTPRNALLVQGGIALLLVLLGAFTEEAVSTMVDYTAPVFWFFLMVTTLSLFVFRYRGDPPSPPYRVPGYPVTPVLFAATCAYLLWSSLTVTGYGALYGAGILLLGIPVYWWVRR
ncbi:MAG: APC family permease [Balneolaceae bacterium]|nr:APC family permease [Balneolaceae bacterium]